MQQSNHWLATKRFCLPLLWQTNDSFVPLHRLSATNDFLKKAKNAKRVDMVKTENYCSKKIRFEYHLDVMAACTNLGKLTRSDGFLCKLREVN